MAKLAPTIAFEPDYDWDRWRHLKSRRSHTNRYPKSALDNLPPLTQNRVRYQPQRAIATWLDQSGNQNLKMVSPDLEETSSMSP